MAIDSLTPDPHNARLHGEKDRAAVAESLRLNGQLKPITVRRPDLSPEWRRSSSGRVRGNDGGIRSAKGLAAHGDSVARNPSIPLEQQNVATELVMSQSPLSLSPRCPRSQLLRIASLVAVLVPFAGLIAAIVMLWGVGFSWLHLWLLVGMYLATVLGITIGFHRLFTHRSFETYAPVKWILAILGSMAVEGPLLKWVAQHRRHHQHSDHEEDPHSPHLHGEGFQGMVKGLWYAHIGWLFQGDAPGLERYVPDLAADRGLRFISTWWGLWALIGLIIPAALGGLISRSWTGAALGFVWGGLVRLFFVHHVTWSINSVCHVWGAQPFRSHDESRNNLIFGILGLGEGWHNTHHAFPTSARHGLSWWQIDVSYYLIRLMQLVGLAWNVRVPTAEKRAEKRTDRTESTHGLASRGHPAA